MNFAPRLASLGLLVAAWYVGAELAGPRMLPGPLSVATAIWTEATSGELAFQLGVTLARVAVSFAIAMLLGTVLGVVMGRSRLADRLADPWLVVLLNLPALVIIVLAYVWAGLTEAAGIAAVVLNKLPNATVTVREGARSFDRQLDEMAEVFRMSPWTRLRHVLHSTARALPRGGGAVGAFAGVEDRADRRASGAAERGRLRDRHGVPAVRRSAHPRLCYRVRPRDAGDRNLPGAAD